MVLGGSHPRGKVCAAGRVVYPAELVRSWASRTVPTCIQQLRHPDHHVDRQSADSAMVRAYVPEGVSGLVEDIPRRPPSRTVTFFLSEVVLDAGVALVQQEQERVMF